MRTAIDRLHLGMEKEVAISDFDGYKQDNRFVCPECGEYVFPVVGRRNGFKHYKKKDVECDRRVDCQASCSYYERVGLPLYLQKSGSSFLIKIGFPPLTNNLLDVAISKKAKLTITSKTFYNAEQMVFNIDNFNFTSDSTTLLQIDVVPYNDTNYCIAISDKTLEKEIFKIWSNYADGFTALGALFSYTESGGKKIRKNDTIESNITYYWIIPSGSFKARSGLTTNYIATISLGKKLFEIYSVAVEHKSETEFRSLANFFWNCLKVRLLYVKPEIIPLWPPVIQTEQCVISVQINPNDFAVFCKIKSDNENPIVYQYSESDCKEIYVYGKEAQSKWAILVLTRLLQPFTIDRKYLANSIIFSQKMVLFQTMPPEFLLVVNDEQAKTVNELLLEKVPADFVFISQKTATLICWNKSQALQTINIKPNEPIVFQFNTNATEMWVIDKMGGYIICKIKRKESLHNDDKSGLEVEILIAIIKKCLTESTIPIPRKNKEAIIQLMKHPACCTLLLPTISRGRIQPTILKSIVLGGTFNERN